MTQRQSTSAKSERTRRRIVTAAAAAYRERGIERTGVRDVMKRAGLTQGGFYFHFRDKDELFAEASRQAVTTTAEWLFRAAEAASPGKQLRAFIDTYLSREHRDSPGSGCMISALGCEVARGERRLRAVFSGRTLIMLERLAPYLPGATAAERRQKAGVLLASMAGVLMASRVLTDSSQSDRLLEGARQFFAASFAEV
jgi:TetR/AcrR family transcriptional regulator, transcriptional repressor for nem operon